MPLSRFPLRRTLFTLAVTAVFAPSLHAADKGRWINDGFGRATRDGRDSSCVSSGGETHAFANPGCEGAGAATAGGRAEPATDAMPKDPGRPAATGDAAAPAAAPPVILVEDPDAKTAATPSSARRAPAPAAATVRDTSGAPVRDSLARRCVLDVRGVGLSGADCDGAAADGGTSSPAAAAAESTAAAAEPAPAAIPLSDGSGADTSGGAGAAAAVGAGAALALAEDHDALAEDDDEPLAAEADDDGLDGDDGEDDTPWLADPDENAAVRVAGAEVDTGGEGLPDAAAAAAVNVADPAGDRDLAPPAAPPAAPAPALRRVLQVEKSALFDTNSAVLKQRSVPELDELAALLRGATSHGTVTVVGHTDRLGSDKLNQRLSERRAKAVRDYLVTRGVDPTRIIAEGRGRMQPATAPGACDRLKRKALRACLAPDRRVEIEAEDIQLPAPAGE